MASSQYLSDIQLSVLATEPTVCKRHSLASDLAADPFTLWARLVWVSQGIHDNVGLVLDLVDACDVRILVDDEEEVHEITTGT